MPRFAANLSTLFTDSPFLDRFERAAAAGFLGVEYLFPYDHDPDDIAERLGHHHLEQILFNLPAGDWAAGDRGLAALPDRVDDFRASVETALSYARRLKCKRLHAMAGIVPPDTDRSLCDKTFIENIRFAADAVAADGVTILIEALNERDVPHYFVAHQLAALDLVRRIDRPNVALQLDYYHAQIMDGDLTRLTERLVGSVGHIQIASVPDRHEPGEGEINYSHIFRTLERLGYVGWIGCEYTPRGRTEAGLSWLAEAMRGS